MPTEMYDVIIVGGGPAGLSAGLVLGRCRRRVLLIDAGKPRNAAARAMHGFLTRDGAAPGEFLQIAREQLARYDGVEMLTGCAVSAQRQEEQFTVHLADGRSFSSRILLLATGLNDQLPAIPGIERFYGKSVHLCPYCDGWEHRDERICVYGPGQAGADLALEMLGWSSKITWVTGGGEDAPGEQCLRKLAHYQVRCLYQRIEKLEGEGDQLRAVWLEGGERLPCDSLFFTSTQSQQSPLAESLGCRFCEDETAVEHCDTAIDQVPGLYVAGNVSRGLQLVIMAVADGTLAAFKINERLLEADQQRLKELLPGAG